jgi:hypothetical protein
MFRAIASALVCVALPLALLLVGVRLATALAPLDFRRAGFPPDPWGMTAESRAGWSDRILAFLGGGGRGLEQCSMAPKEIPPERDPEEGQRAFTTREILHLRDVGRLYRSACWTGWAALLALVFGAFGSRQRIFAVLRAAALCTLALMATLLLAAALAPDAMMDRIHGAFFSSGSFLFYGTDTLVRVYPPEFWRDFLVFVTLFATAGAGAILALAWRR